MSNLIPLRPGAEEYARAETERKHQLFAWADRVLQQLGLMDALARASSLDELRKVIFDPDAADVALVIRAALHPAHGTKADYLAGLRICLSLQLRPKLFFCSSHGRRQLSQPNWL